jgi:hypothetical protein
MMRSTNAAILRPGAYPSSGPGPSGTPLSYLAHDPFSQVSLTKKHFFRVGVYCARGVQVIVASDGSNLARPTSCPAHQIPR